MRNTNPISGSHCAHTCKCIGGDVVRRRSDKAAKLVIVCDEVEAAPLALYGLLKIKKRGLFKHDSFFGFVLSSLAETG